MELDANRLVVEAVRNGIQEAVKTRFSTTYDNPFQKILTQAIDGQAGAIRSLLDAAIASCLGDAAFRADIAQAVRHSLAKSLVQRFGGELEKQVNQLKSDPATRARITLAIEEIVRERVAATA